MVAAPADAKAGKTQAEVTISKPFYMGVYEVTVDQYRQFSPKGDKRGTIKTWGPGSPEYHQRGGIPFFNWSFEKKEVKSEQNGNHPALAVLAEDAEKFCEWLSEKTGKKVRLPTEAQWEYACRADIGGRLTAPVVAQGRLLAADIDRHTVHCLDTSTGTPTWTYMAGGRIDSPPTIDAGRALFGCRDGWVYCLRLADGALVWRLRAAPGERQIVANGQLESSWPLHGGVLVNHGVAYVAAGRATRLDGGIRVLAIDPATGRVIRKVTFDTPQRTAPLKDNFDPDERTGFLTDIMVADGEDVWMRTARFTPQLQAEFTGFRGGTGGGGMSPTGGVTALAHLTAVSGFLDDRYFDRVYWGYEGVFGQMLVVDRQMVYGVRAYDHTGFGLSYRPGSGYVLFGETHEGKKPRNPPPVKLKDEPSEKGAKDNEAPDVRQEIFRPHPLPSNLWTRQCDIRVIAMALAQKTLILVGPPDSVDPKDPYAVFEGRGPAKLRLASAADGSTLAEMDLESGPVWNGLAVAGGRVFLTTTDGKVLCLAGKQAAPASTRP